MCVRMYSAAVARRESLGAQRERGVPREPVVEREHCAQQLLPVPAAHLLLAQRALRRGSPPLRSTFSC